MSSVYVIKNASGEFYTGNLVRGEAEFVPLESAAIELSMDEALQELDGDSMPIDAKHVLLYDYKGRSTK